jgi:predicted transcriptional regulator
MMTVADLIKSRQDVFSITENTTVHDAARYLREKQIRAAGVFTSQGKLIGVLSQSDVSDKVAAENKSPDRVVVSEIMSTELIAVSPEKSLDECLVLMEGRGIYHLLVIDDTGRYRGMISAQDLLKVMASDQKSRADQLEDYITGRR